MNIKKTSTPSDELGSAFERLKKLLTPYAEHFSIKEDSAKEYSLVGKSRQNNRKRFGAVVQRAGFVTFYLCPTLLQDASPRLKDRMKGTACVQFVGVDEPALEEIAAFLSRRYQSYCREGAF